jgi:hypothetical protein
MVEKACDAVLRCGFSTKEVKLPAVKSAASRSARGSGVRSDSIHPAIQYTMTSPSVKRNQRWNIVEPRNSYELGHWILAAILGYKHGPQQAQHTPMQHPLQPRVLARHPQMFGLLHCSVRMRMLDRGQQKSRQAGLASSTFITKVSSSCKLRRERPHLAGLRDAETLIILGGFGRHSCGETRTKGVPPRPQSRKSLTMK